ncbi:MAG: ABC transporter permease [Caldilineaceae bacterium]|nr:ABC transporter permease [Caldilineaceae bacterium]MCB9137051.1 ABC transporter permease [Caldilineaceae bacterium]
MLRFIVRRLLTTILVILGVTFISFLIIHLVPGDPARIMLGLNATEEKVAEVQRAMGLDRPFIVQYGNWLADLLRGNLGESFITGQSVTQAVVERLPRTLTLAGAALVIALLIALPAGIIAALRPRSPAAYFATIFSQVGVSIPDFWMGIMLILLFSLTLRWLPPSGYAPFSESPLEWLRHLILPAVTVGIVSGSVLTRFVRSAMLEALHQDYVRTARAKGISERHVVLRHVLRNAMIPIVTVTGLQLAGLLGGVVIVEVIFAWPGLGRLALDAVQRRDYPMMQGAVLFVALAFALVNLLVDILYAYLDPRIKY